MLSTYSWYVYKETLALLRLRLSFDTLENYNNNNEFDSMNLNAIFIARYINGNKFSDKSLSNYTSIAEANGRKNPLENRTVLGNTGIRDNKSLIIFQK